MDLVLRIKNLVLLMEGSNQESCVINGGTTTNYFKLERGTRQGNPISAYSFLLVLEIAFSFIMQNEHINGLSIF